MIANFDSHASNERTFLAWVRTAIAIVGFGLAVSRVGNLQTALWSEVLLLVAGAVVVLVAYVRMRHVRKRIDARDQLDDSSVPTDTLLLLLVAALFALLAVFAVHVR
jgi:putative membrane protein